MSSPLFPPNSYQDPTAKLEMRMSCQDTVVLDALLPTLVGHKSGISSSQTSQGEEGKGKNQFALFVFFETRTRVY